MLHSWTTLMFRKYIPWIPATSPGPGVLPTWFLSVPYSQTPSMPQTPASGPPACRFAQFHQLCQLFLFPCQWVALPSAWNCLSGALCLTSSFPSSGSQCLLLGQTIPGHPFHLRTFSHHLIYSSMALCFCPLWPLTQSVMSVVFLFRISLLN